jgi:carboxyl-terminal processing protease
MRGSRPALAISIIGVALWSAMAAAQYQPAQYRPVRVDGRPVPEVHGVWRSRGHGYLVRIDQNGHQLFHIARDFCYPDDIDQKRTIASRIRQAFENVRGFVRKHLGLRAAKHDPEDMFGFYLSLGPATISFSGEPDLTRYVFDRLPELPPACTDQTPWSAPRIAALVAATFADIYPSFEQRGIDWPARTAAALAALDESSDDDALYSTLEAMLAGIDDPHVALQAEVNGTQRALLPGDGPTLSRLRAAIGDKAMDENEWPPAYRQGGLDVVLAGKGHETANGRLFWGRVGEIGYLNLLSMERLSRWGLRDDETVLDAALDQAIAAFAGARAVIVDVSYNLGGYDRVSHHVAGRFADARRLAFTKVGFGAHNVEPQPIYVEPSKRARYLGPVYLVTSDATVSAGETFTLFMRALPNVVHVGTTTRGALSDLIEKPLPNGWALALAGEIYRDPQGENYEVRGIPPQVEFDMFPPDELIGGHARRVLALMEELRRLAPGDRLDASRLSR